MGNNYSHKFDIIATVGMAGLFLSYRLLFVVLFVNCPTWNDLAEIFQRGIFYDFFTIGLLFLPIGIMSIIRCLIEKNQRIVTIWICSYYFVVFTLTFLYLLITIQHYYFLHRFITFYSISHINDIRSVAEMIIQEKYIAFGLFSVLFISCFCFIGIKPLYRIIKKSHSNTNIIYQCIFLLLCISGLFVKSTILNKKILFMQVADAYFSQITEQNEAVLNPLFVLYKTTVDNLCKQNIPIIDYQKCYDKNKSENRVDDSPTPSSNVVLIIMEGMQSSFGTDSTLTPFINKLKRESLCFSKAYSSGVHTAHAVFSLITSLPSQCEHPFTGHMPCKYKFSLATELKRNGYDTFFMMPHNIRFDNMNGFLLLNGFNKIYSQCDFPKSETVNAFGINDHSLFEHAIKEIDQKTKVNPIFCTILTVSNHIPYTIPKQFPKTGLERKYRIVQYADWALSEFFKKAMEKKWYRETLFVLVGDHAREYSGTEIFEVDNHHVECIIHDPQYRSYHVNNNIAGHVDIAPTILGYLRINNYQHPYGIDLNKQKRDYLLMSSDGGLECINDSMYCRYLNKNDYYIKAIKDNNRNDNSSSLSNYLLQYLQ